MKHLSDAHFNTQLDDWVSKAIDEQQPDFRELLKSLPGIYPSEVLKTLRRLTERRQISNDYEVRILTQAKTPASKGVVQRNQPSAIGRLEHPLDFEWRFTRSALDALCKKLEDLTGGRSATALCLGCPSVFSFGRKQLPSYNFVLRDKNASTVTQGSETQKLINFDLAHEPIPDMHADIAIIDPPWYNDYYKLFVWAALQNLKPNGHIILSFPPIGTRPSAKDDFDLIIKWCCEVGIILQEHLKLRLPYRSPFFEVNAFKAEGIYGVPLDWRRGDMIVLKVKEKLIIPRPPIPEFATNWTETCLGPVRIKIREDISIVHTILTPVGDSSILGSVSSRHPHRASANVVTSGNRFLQTEFPKKLAALCQDFDGTINNNLNNDLPHSLLRKELVKLLDLEQAEISEYLTQIDDL